MAGRPLGTLALGPQGGRTLSRVPGLEPGTAAGGGAGTLISCIYSRPRPLFGDICHDLEGELGEGSEAAQRTCPLRLPIQSPRPKRDGSAVQTPPRPPGPASSGRLQAREGSGGCTAPAEAVLRTGAPGPPDARGPIGRGHLPVTGHQDLRMHGDQWLPISAPCCQVHGLAQGGQCHHTGIWVGCPQFKPYTTAQSRWL